MYTKYKILGGPNILSIPLCPLIEWFLIFSVRLTLASPCPVKFVFLVLHNKEYTYLLKLLIRSMQKIYVLMLVNCCVKNMYESMQIQNVSQSVRNQKGKSLNQNTPITVLPVRYYLASVN